MFETNSIVRYVVAVSVLAALTYLGNQLKRKYAASDPDKDYEMVKMYLLNDSALTGKSKPKLWIHTKYEVNARKWLSFGSPNTTDLNQPYLHLTAKSILHHCNNDFQVLLIDDSTFRKLLDDWSFDLERMAEPLKTHYRKIGLAMLVHRYGGMVIPGSFVCLKSLREMYDSGCHGKRAFCVETINRTSKCQDQTFLPGLSFFGADAECPAIGELIAFLHSKCRNGHLTDEPQFDGDTENWLSAAIRADRFHLLDGGLVGIKTHNCKQRVLIEDLMEERRIDLSPDCFGVYIDQDEILRRPAYKWFAVMSTHDIVESSMILGKYIKRATADYLSEYGDGVHHGSQNGVKSISAI